MKFLPCRGARSLALALPEAKLDHLRLVSLGVRCWQDIEQYGLRIWFTDPDTGSILHLSRSWQRSEQENSPAATRRLFSF